MIQADIKIKLDGEVVYSHVCTFNNEKKTDKSKMLKELRSLKKYKEETFPDRAKLSVTFTT